MNMMMEGESALIWNQTTNSITSNMKCAYASAVLEAVEFALTKNHNLFQIGEISTLSAIQCLPYDSVRIVGRLLTRKSKWVKVSKMDDYLKDSSDPLTSVTLAVDHLIDASLMESLTSHKDFLTVWNIAETSFGSEDWSLLTQRLTSGKPKGGQRKEDVIRSLRRTIESQKTCFGKSLKDRFVDIVNELSKTIHKSNWVRLRLDVSKLIRRTQRLLQVQIPHNS